jgi:hypothetical protein
VEQFAIEMLKVLWAKSDPMLILCVLAVIWMQYRDRKNSKAVRDRLDAHLNPNPKDNPYPHPQCREGEISYAALCKQLEIQHRENREDHGKIFDLLGGRNK